MTAAYPWLVADVGGTNARFGTVSGPGAAVEDVRVLPVAGHAGPAAAVEAYLAGRAPGAIRPRSAAFALATALHGDHVELTNGAWSFSRAATQQALGLQTLLCLNDFEAQALSLPRLRANQLRAWGAPPPSTQDVAVGTVMAVIGPGTGLGVGGVVALAVAVARAGVDAGEPVVGTELGADLHGIAVGPDQLGGGADRDHPPGEIVDQLLRDLARLGRCRQDQGEEQQQGGDGAHGRPFGESDGGHSTAGPG